MDESVVLFVVPTAVMVAVEMAATGGKIVARWFVAWLHASAERERLNSEAYPPFFEHISH
jgi:hypothetical protein